VGLFSDFTADPRHDELKRHNIPTVFPRSGKKAGNRALAATTDFEQRLPGNCGAVKKIEIHAMSDKRIGCGQITANGNTHRQNLLFYSRCTSRFTLFTLRTASCSARRLPNERLLIVQGRSLVV